MKRRSFIAGLSSASLLPMFHYPAAGNPLLFRAAIWFAGAVGAAIVSMGVEKALADTPNKTQRQSDKQPQFQQQPTETIDVSSCPVWRIGTPAPSLIVINNDDTHLAQVKVNIVVYNENRYIDCPSSNWGIGINPGMSDSIEFDLCKKITSPGLKIVRCHVKASSSNNYDASGRIETIVRVE